jgi:hypothetical protein
MTPAGAGMTSPLRGLHDEMTEVMRAQPASSRPRSGEVISSSATQTHH